MIKFAAKDQDLFTSSFRNWRKIAGKDFKYKISQKTETEIGEKTISMSRSLTSPLHLQHSRTPIQRNERTNH